MKDDEPITVVSVTYNSSAIIPEMLKSLPDGTRAVIVDNGSKDVDQLQLVCDHHGATLLRNADNLGFGAACNQGARLATTPFILFLNPDAVLHEGALSELYSAAQRYPNAVAFNPRFITSDGKSFYKRSSRLMPRKERMPRTVPTNDEYVSVLSGAAFFVRRQSFEAVSGFDENIFLYHEDDDLARRLLRSCGKLMFVSNAHVEHIGGASTEDTPAIAALKSWYLARSRVYATRKHGARLPLFAAFITALKNLFSIDMAYSRRRRAKNLAYLRGVISCISDGGAGKGSYHG